MNISSPQFPYRISADCPVAALTKAAMALGVLLDRAHVIHGVDAMQLEEQTEGSEHDKAPRELYDDADSEHREGEATPRKDPVRDARQGKVDGSNVEKPGEAAERRR